MPITGKFSKLFYDRLGDQVANELVDWLNAVDTAYRTDLRELNETNFTRFDARLEQRIAGLDARLEKEIGILNARMDQLAAELRADLDARFAKALVKLSDTKVNILWWMFAFWMGNVAVLIVSRLVL